MSDDIRKILARIDEALTPVSVKKGLNPQQRSVPQLPADFKPKTIRALGAPTDPQHPMTGMAVGASESQEQDLEERCWDGYRQQGMKKKGDRQVPNCVKVNERDQEHDEAGKRIRPQNDDTFATYFRKKGSTGTKWYAGTKHVNRADADRAAKKVLDQHPDYEYIIREERQKAKTRNPVAKNAPRSGAGAHTDKKHAARRGETKHRQRTPGTEELSETQHRESHARYILSKIPEGYRGPRLYEKILNTIVKKFGPMGQTAERREFYQTLAADVMERYIQKFPASAAMREDRASDEHRKAQRISDDVWKMMSKLDSAKMHQAMGHGQDALQAIATVMRKFSDTFEGKIPRSQFEDFLVPLDYCENALASGNWDHNVMDQTIDISINLLDEMNDQIWREINQVKDDDEGGISIGDLSENYDDEEDDEEEGQEDVGFFVVIANEDDGVFIGYVTKEDGRWYERRVSGKPPYAWGGPKYMSYLTPRDVMNWIHRDFERHYEVKGPFADEESARDYASQFLDENSAMKTPKNRLQESGETYTWTAHFADGTTKQMNIATDEVPYAREAFAMKFPGKDIARVTTDWKVAGGQHAHGAVTAMPDRRPTEPYGRDVDNPMVREQSLAEAMAEIEEDMLSKVKNDLTRYLDKLEKKVKKEIGLSKKEAGVKEDPTAVDVMTVPPPAPIQDPVMPESAPVKSIALEDGSVLEIHGDQLRGFEVRRGGRSLPTRFPNLDHAQMAVDLYQQRRQTRDDSADYVEER